jgi:hypothetical protein
MWFVEGAMRVSIGWRDKDFYFAFPPHGLRAGCSEADEAKTQRAWWMGGRRIEAHATLTRTQRTTTERSAGRSLTSTCCCVSLVGLCAGVHRSQIFQQMVLVDKLEDLLPSCSTRSSFPLHRLPLHPISSLTSTSDAHTATPSTPHNMATRYNHRRRWFDGCAHLAPAVMAGLVPARHV